jgi:HEAT repeat protein
VEKPIVLLFGGLVASHFGLEAATASSLATLALCMPINMGRNAWCKAYKARKERASQNQYMDGERENLLLIANFRSDLNSKDSEKRIDAMHKIASYQLVDEETVPLLANSMQHDDRRVRGAAAFALAWAGVVAEPAIPKLLEGLKDPDEWVRAHSARALGQFRNAASTFLEKLTDCLLKMPIPGCGRMQRSP